MTQLQRGGNAPVSGNAIEVVASFTAPAGIEADISCYLLGSDGRVRADADMIFYNQPSGADGAVTLTGGGGTTRFAVNLDAVPAAIARITFCLTIDGGHSFASLAAARIAVEGQASFEPERAGASEAAMILGELYRRDSAWKFRAVGQGFDGGLGPLARSFGISVDDEPSAPPAPAPAAPDLVKKPPVILTKPEESQRISLAKSGPVGKLVVTATWVDNGDGNDDNDDLDLRVGLLKPDGSFEMIHAPDQPGAFDSAPFVRHLGDVRQASVNAPATETVEVNPAITARYGGRVGLVFSVYSAIANGVVSVPSLKPRMRMEYGEDVVECAFDFLSKRLKDEESIYTYVLGTAVIDGDSVTLQPSGMTSDPGSEDTPRLSWGPGDAPVVTVDGEPVFKDDF